MSYYPQSSQYFSQPHFFQPPTNAYPSNTLPPELNEYADVFMAQSAYIASQDPVLSQDLSLDPSFFTSPSSMPSGPGYSDPTPFYTNNFPTTEFSQHSAPDSTPFMPDLFGDYPPTGGIREVDEGWQAIEPRSPLFPVSPMACRPQPLIAKFFTSQGGLVLQPPAASQHACTPYTLPAAVPHPYPSAGPSPLTQLSSSPPNSDSSIGSSSNPSRSSYNPSESSYNPSTQDDYVDDDDDEEMESPSEADSTDKIEPGWLCGYPHPTEEYTYCNAFFGNLCDQQRHLTLHHATQEYAALTKGARPESLVFGGLPIKTGAVVCPKCGKTFSRADARKRHARSCTNSTPKNRSAISDFYVSLTDPEDRALASRLCEFGVPGAPLRERLIPIEVQARLTKQGGKSRVRSIVRVTFWAKQQFRYRLIHSGTRTSVEWVLHSPFAPDEGADGVPFYTPAREHKAFAGWDGDRYTSRRPRSEVVMRRRSGSPAGQEPVRRSQRLIRKYYLSPCL